MVKSVPGLLTGDLPTGIQEGGNDHQKLRRVAAEFESLLVAQMLRSVRESSAGGWLGGGEDQASQSMVEIAEQQFARLLASQGGLGLQDLIEQGLSSRLGKSDKQGQ